MNNAVSEVTPSFINSFNINVMLNLRRLKTDSLDAYE